MLASDDSFVELDRKTGVEVGVVPETLLDELLIVGVINEELGIGSERDKSPVGLGGGPLLHAPHLDALLKGGGGILPVTEGGYREFFRKRIDGLCTYTVKTDGELESLRVVFRTGIYDGYALHHLTERDTASEVPDGDTVVQDGHVYPGTGTHDEFIDTVIDYFLEKYVDTVIHMGTVTQSAYVHSGSESYVLQ